MSKEKKIFEFSQALKEEDSITIYYLDVDLNTYKVKVIFKDGGFYIDGVPFAYRSDFYYSMSRKWLDSLVSFIFPKDWYLKDKIPLEHTLTVKSGT